MKRLQARYIISCTIYTAMHTYHYDSAKLVRIVMPPPATPATPVTPKSEFNIGLLQCLISAALRFCAQLYKDTPTVLAMFTEEFTHHKYIPDELYIRIDSISDIETFAIDLLRTHIFQFSTAGNEQVLVLANFITAFAATIRELCGNGRFYDKVLKNPVNAMGFASYAVIEYTQLGDRLKTRLVKLMNDENAKNITRTMDSMYTP
jgi:hypothetical protein